MDLLSSFIKSISNYQLQNKKILLAVSGGIDSVVLCELSRQGGINFSIVHCNFGLRAEESERDEKFVRNLGEKYRVDMLVKKFDTINYASENNLSVQEAARDLRYHWFEEIRKEKSAAYTLLAHHANDNIETLLMNFFRGTGLDGLTGMPKEKKEAHCLRPMLEMKRADIEAFANENNLQWVEDSSNSSSKYTRNFFRNELIPQLQKAYPQAEENLLKNIHRFRQTKILYKQMLAELKKKVCEVKGEEVYIPVLKLMKYENTSLLYEIISDYGFNENMVEELIKLADAASGKFISNTTHRIIKHRKWFIIAPNAVTASNYVINKEDELVLFGKQQLQLKYLPTDKFSLLKSESIAQLDASKIEFPLFLRKWKTGDYFYPLGMRKKKKLARFFIDQKLSKTKKENVWVLESHNKIVWVVGHRIDDRFKITDFTKNILQLILSSP